MSLNLATHEVFQLEQLALHEMAKTLWKNLVSQHPEEMSITFSITDKARLYDVKLYRETVQRLLPEHLPPRFPKILKEKLVDAMVDIKLGYTEAFHWIIWYDDLIKLSQRKRDFNLKQESQNLICSLSSPNTAKYEAIHFIKPLGHFDDLSWAKLFVADDNHSLKSRFYLACLYCFEQEIYSLWSAMKSCNQTLSQDEIEEIKDKASFLVELWVSRLEGESQFRFYFYGWECSFDGLHEHGATFFWNHCSDFEKSKILSKLNWTYIYRAILSNRVGFVHFIYSLLSKKLKYKVMWDIHTDKANTFSSLLCSPYYKSFLIDILTDPHTVPISFYGRILFNLSLVIRKSAISRHKEIFIALWNGLSADKRIQVLTSVSCILHVLIDINDLDLFEMILLRLPPWAKEELLLKGVPRYFSELRENFEGLVPYLLFLLLDYDDVSQKFVLRSDAENLLDLFVSQIKLTSKPLMVNVIIDFLKQTFPVAREQLRQMEQAPIVHGFLSRKIYPLFSLKGNELYSSL